MIKKVLKYFCIATLVVATAFLVISYVTVKKFTGRTIKTEKLVEYEHERARAINELGAQGVTFVTEDGVQLSGLLFVRSHAQRTVMVVHGYRMAKEELLVFPSMMPDDTVLLFDVRAHGQSCGDTITFGSREQLDVKAAADFLQADQRIGTMPLYAIGISMGGVAVLGAAIAHPELFRAVVIESCFSDLYEQLARAFESKTGLMRIPFFSITKFLFEYRCGIRLADVSPRVWITKLTTPLLIIHSEFDELAPVTDADELYDADPGIKELWLVAGSGHARIFKDMPQEYFAKVADFFSKHD